ncbi:unnamed protein product [Rotaria sp. Silwood2]|nr:unnamed protein product [Rotaria sp. Silwood2]CAF3039439.1 unnamed protein product [Rotaria sp. Silwood2]CAF3564039.1 unnamed protein product [Rotaria sp. Silwood2]CAF4335015.1 unnamed protein product [Rotaria sp. Silwood2]CAF4593104.1 unnamed protein product [Rotaria sp. Silwood2]
MSNELNVNDNNPRSLTNTALQDINSYDLMTSYSDSWQSISNSSYENQNLDRLKARINCFIREHSNLVGDIKNYFYDEIITYSVKRSFRLPFSKTDITNTERLINRFFIEHETTIRYIFTYFFDDIKSLLLNNHFLSFISDLRIINSIINCGMREAIILFLKFKGAQMITLRLYRTEIEQNQNGNVSSEFQLTFNKMKFIQILAYFILLCAIFGWEILHIIRYFFIGLMCLIFYVYLSTGSYTIKIFNPI